MKLIEADNHPAGGIIAKIQPFLPLRRKTTLANINSLPLALDSCHSSPSLFHTKRSEKHSACTTCTLLHPSLPSSNSNKLERNAKRNFEEKAATSSPVHIAWIEGRNNGGRFPDRRENRCRIGGKETVSIPVKIRSNNRCGKQMRETTRDRTNTKPPLLPWVAPPKKASVRMERKKEGEHAVKTRHCVLLPGYLGRRVLTIVHNYERGAVPNKKHYSSEV